MRSKRTGATGSSTEKLIEIEIPTLASTRIKGFAATVCLGLRSERAMAAEIIREQ
jgi:hypothetical protein